MANVNNIGLKNLVNKVKYYSSAKFTNDIAKNMVKEGKDKLSLEYSFNLAINDVEVGGDARANGTGTIFAKGREVPFEEFGTGKVGEKSNYPEEILPSDTLRFQSPAGYDQQTEGWVYYYDNPLTKLKHKGKYGWIHKGLYTRGKPAGKQVYNTAKYLRSNMVSIVKKTIKENVK